MDINLKSNIDHKQKSQASWPVTTLKKLISITIKNLSPPVFYFKWTQADVHHNINILVAFN